MKNSKRYAWLEMLLKDNSKHFLHLEIFFRDKKNV